MLENYLQAVPLMYLHSCCRVGTDSQKSQDLTVVGKRCYYDLELITCAKLVGLEGRDGKESDLSHISISTCSSHGVF